MNISSLFTSDYIIANTNTWNLTFNIPDVKNPRRTSPSDSFSILTKYDNNNYDVEDSRSLNISISATAGTID